jgi:hypothetical protein
MKTIFFTICDSQIQKREVNSRNLDFRGFMNSFKKFHPDIEMKVFDEHDMANMRVNYYNAKATFGQLLSKDYDLVVNVDSDHYFFDRCEEILTGDYDVACPANFNETNNLVGIKVSSGITGEGNKNWIVTEEEFLQGGLIASPSKQFWNHYKHTTDKYYDKFVCFENDILNLVAYLYPYKVRVLDGHCDYRNPLHTRWYGCSIINKEKKCIVENGKITCEGKPVKAYHFAHGGGKRKYTDVFSQEVSQFIKTNII